MFSSPPMFCRGAQHAGNGGSLVKCWNKAAGHQGSARLLDIMGVSLSSPTDGVAHRTWVTGESRSGSLAAFEKGTTLPFKPRLAVNDDKLTEYGNTTVKEH